MIKYTESICRMKASKNNLAIVEATYVIFAELDGNADTCMRRITFDAPDVASFIAFENVQESDVLKWAKDKLGLQEIDAMKSGMLAKLSSIPQDTVVNVAPPWTTSNE